MHYQPLRFGYLLQSMVSLASYKLESVHKTIYQSSSVTPDHTARKDRMALEEVLEEVLRQAARLEQENMQQ
jgi:hypothetical protein